MKKKGFLSPVYKFIKENVFIGNDEKILARKHWKKIEGKTNSEKISFLLKKHNVKQKQFAFILGVSESLICKIRTENKTPGDKFKIAIYRYEQNPEQAKYNCRDCGKEMLWTGHKKLCPDCKQARIDARKKPKPYECESCHRVFYNPCPRKYCDDCKKPTDRQSLYFSFMN